MKDKIETCGSINMSSKSTISEKSNMIKKWTICKYYSNEHLLNNNPYEVSEIDGNVLLNEGITALQKLLINSGSQPTPFSNASASLGVGTDNTPETASQTGLLGTSSYATMSDGYPQINQQSTTWRAVFTSGSANYDWREFTVANSASNAGTNLNRKVSNQGTKAPGQVWTLDLEITWS